MQKVWLLLPLVLIFAAPLAGWLCYGRLLQNATGFIAHTACDEV